jgi:WD40 repeat protein
MHTAMIRRAATDAAGRVALTCSADKTARLWALPDLTSEVSNPKAALLRTFRIPIGSGDEGKLYACALSADGAVAAMAGWTSNESGNVESIYLFDTASGQLLRRLSGLPNVILDLAFSPSGQTLAAVLGKGGLRLFATRSGQLLAQDSDYGSPSYGVDWQGERRLVTTCWDGKLRLYQGLDLGSAGSGTGARRQRPGQAGEKSNGNVDVNRIVNELSSAENGTVVFASSTGRQQSIESEEWGNGAFTKALVEGLNGQADLLKKGEIKISTLEAYVADRVKDLTKGEQTPTVAKPQTVQDYTIALRRK